MQHKLFFFLVLLLSAQISKAQTRYIVQLKNKGGSTFTLAQPQQYLSQRSIDRRLQHNIALDSTDLPVTPAYIDSLRTVPGVAVLNASKWLNQVSIQIGDAAALEKINRFAFVQAAWAIAAKARHSNLLPQTSDNKTGRQGSLSVTDNFYNYGSARGQVDIHNGSFLHNIGLRGQGMIIGMLDAGFYNYTSLKAFDSVNQHSQVLGTWDFVAREQSVVEDNAHGMQCLSVIAANIPGQFIGTSPKASFYLFRTEDAGSEYPIEEHNWVCGAEKLDSAGGQVISSSLGYSTFDDGSYNYTYATMNGRSTLSSKGAGMAAKKGLLVLNAAGNSGNDFWKYITTPADADSILAVGAVDVTGRVASFSSYGPSADGRVKPDVASVGANTIVQGTNNTVVGGYGTSFACPNMTGLVTCLWQGFPEANNMAIINAIRKAGSIYNTPNDRIGYGIPDVKKALMLLLQDFATISFSATDCHNTISWKSKDAKGMKYEIERKTAGDTAFRALGQQWGSGDVFGIRQYTFKDTTTYKKNTTVTYRIKEVIDTTVATYTSLYIGTVNGDVTPCISNERNKIIQLLPNHTTGLFNLRINERQAIPQLKIVVTNTLGKALLIEEKTKPEGIATYPFNIGHLSRGTYFLSVYNQAKLLVTETVVKL